MTRYAARYDPLLARLVTLPIVEDPTLVVRVGKDNELFTSIQDAIDSITDAASNKIYLVLISPGIYTEDLTLKPFVYLSSQAVISSSVRVLGSVTASFSNAGDVCYINSMSFRHEVASDGGVSYSFVGGVIARESTFLTTNPTSDYGATCVYIESTTASSQLLLCGLGVNSTYANSTKDLIGLHTAGTLENAVIQNTLGVVAAASGGNITCHLHEGTGRFNNASNDVRGEIKAAFGGTACGLKVTSVSSSVRICSDNAINIVNSVSGGTAYGVCLDTSGSNGEIFHKGSLIYIDGFSPATEYASYTGAGDIQKVWLNSSNKDLTKDGTGLCITTPFDLVQTGFVAWEPGAVYWSYDSGTQEFTVELGGVGLIRSSAISWLGGQTIGISDRTTNFIYIDNTGTIGVSTTHSDLDYEDNIMLFEVWAQDTNYIVVKENHPVKFNTSVSSAWHDLLGVLLQSPASTLTIADAGTRQVGLTGANVLKDHGLDSEVPATSPITWRQVVTGVGGSMVQVADSTSLATIKSDGTDTGVNVSNGRYFNIRLGVTKESLNTATPIFIAVSSNTDYSNAAAAANAIAANNVPDFPAESKALEVAQLGFATIQADGSGGGTLTTATTALQILGAQYVSGGTSTSASLITTTTTNFLRLLSGSDTSVQLALDTLDAKASKKVTGDLDYTSFTLANNQAAPADITGFAFSNASVRAFKAIASVYIDATADLFEMFEILAIQRGADWALTTTATGDVSGVTFSITNAGQVQYTSANYTGFSTGYIKFRAWVTSV